MYAAPVPHVVHLTTAHDALDARIFHKECRTLAQHGFRVTLVAPHPEEVLVDGIRIVPLPLPRHRLERMTSTVARLMRTAIRLDGQVYHFHDPELIPVGLALKMLGKRVVYDVHEDVPRDVLLKPWLAPWLRRGVASALSALEYVSASIFDGIVAVTPTIARRFPARKTALVRNFPIPGELDGAAPAYRQRSPRVIYVGSITALRGAHEMIGAIARLPGEPTLVLVGSCAPPELENELRTLPGWSRVEAAGWQERDGVATLLGTARVGLVLLHPTPTFVPSYPVKLFEYMAAGLPVVASDFPLWRRIVEEAECGILVDPLDLDAIAAAVAWLLARPAEAEAMGRRGQEAARGIYSWQTEGDRLLALYEGIAA